MTSPTMRRTVTRDRWEAAQAAWAELRLGDEWRPWRHLAAMQAGIVDAPQGTRWDSWDADDPSEVALLTRAIREDPGALREAILAPRVHSWAAVVARVVRARDDRAEEAAARGRLEALDAELERPSRREAMQSLGQIMQIIADSVAR